MKKTLMILLLCLLVLSTFACADVHSETPSGAPEIKVKMPAWDMDQVISVSIEDSEYNGKPAQFVTVSGLAWMHLDPSMLQVYVRDSGFTFEPVTDKNLKAPEDSMVLIFPRDDPNALSCYFTLLDPNPELSGISLEFDRDEIGIRDWFCFSLSYLDHKSVDVYQDKYELRYPGRREEDGTWSEWLRASYTLEGKLIEANCDITVYPEGFDPASVETADLLEYSYLIEPRRVNLTQSEFAVTEIRDETHDLIWRDGAWFSAETGEEDEAPEGIDTESPCTLIGNPVITLGKEKEPDDVSWIPQMPKERAVPGSLPELTNAPMPPYVTQEETDSACVLTVDGLRSWGLTADKAEGKFYTEMRDPAPMTIQADENGKMITELPPDASGAEFTADTRNRMEISFAAIPDVDTAGVKLQAGDVAWTAFEIDEIEAQWQLTETETIAAFYSRSTGRLLRYIVSTSRGEESFDFTYTARPGNDGMDLLNVDYSVSTSDDPDTEYTWIQYTLNQGS